MEETARLRLVQRKAEDVVVVDLVGNLVVGPECVKVRQEMESVMGSGCRKILLNLAAVNYIDSTGIGVLLAAKISALNRSMQLKVCCVPTFAARLLAQLHLTKILDTYEQEEPALRSFTK